MTTEAIQDTNVSTSTETKASQAKGSQDTNVSQTNDTQSNHNTNVNTSTDIKKGRRKPLKPEDKEQHYEAWKKSGKSANAYFTGEGTPPYSQMKSYIEFKEKKTNPNELILENIRFYLKELNETQLNKVRDYLMKLK